MWRAALLTASAALAGVIGVATEDRTVVSQTAATDGLSLEAQTYAVAPGSLAHFELLVTAAVPEIAPTTTTTSTTTTTTTSTTTTTTTLPGDDSTPTGSTEPIIVVDGGDPVAVTSTSEPITIGDPGPEMIVQVRAHRRLTTRSSVDRVLDDSPGPVIDILEFELADVSLYDDSTGERRLILDVPISSVAADVDQLDLLDPGVYPVTIQIRRDSTLVTAHTTFLEVLDTSGVGRGPFRFTVLAALDDPGPDPDPLELELLRSGLREIAELTESSEAPIAIAIPPVAARAALENDENLALRLQAALDSDDGLVAMPDQELEPSAAAAVDLGTEFETRLTQGAVELARRFPIVPVARSAWPTTELLTAPGAAVLRDAGVPLLVVPFDRYLTYDGSLVNLTDTSLLLNARLPDDSPLPMLVVDPITELIDPDRMSDTPPIEDAIRLMASTGVMRYQLDPDLRTMVLTTADLTAPDPEVLTYIEQFVGEHPAYSFQPLDRVSDITNFFFVEGVPVTVTLDDRASVSLEARMQRIGATRLRMADVESMLPQDDGRPAGWDATLRTALSTGLLASEANIRIDTVESELADIRTKVLQPETFSFTITGRDSDIPVRVENTGDTALRVVLRLEAEKLSFPSDTIETVLLANAVTAIPVPVTARSNGVFPVRVEVLTPAGNPLTEPVELTARVSTLAGFGRVVTVGAALVLASWWFSYFRRKRKADRDRRLEDARGRHPAMPDGRSSPSPGPQLASVTSPDADEAAMREVPATEPPHDPGAAHSDTGPAAE